MRSPLTYQEFKDRYLVKNFTDKTGKPKHTRFVKRYFYLFSKDLKKEFKFDMKKCSICGMKDIWNGRPIMLELDHINGITNDSRISNLRMLCPNCHSQTSNYCNRSNSIEEYHSRIFCHA